MFHAPKNVYGPNLFKILVEEIGGPARAAELLDVTEATVKRWMLGATNAPKDCVKVPRAAVLALYWETKYGRSAMFADQVNEIRMLHLQIKILQGQYTRAKDIVAGLRRLHTGTANEAYFDELTEVAGGIKNPYGESAPVLPGAQDAQPAHDTRPALAFA